VPQTPLHTVVTFRAFERDALAAMSVADYEALVDHLAANPTAGDLIPGAGGARKLRWRATGRGKRGGVRAITFYSGTDMPVFMLACYAKSEKSILNEREKRELRTILTAIKETYRRRRRDRKGQNDQSRRQGPRRR
jgi:hypothetical protein